jgi:hypothetical protein
VQPSSPGYIISKGSLNHHDFTYVDLIIKDLTVVENLEGVREASDIVYILVSRRQDRDGNLYARRIVGINHRGVNLGGSLEWRTIAARERNNLGISASHISDSEAACRYTLPPQHLPTIAQSSMTLDDRSVMICTIVGIFSTASVGFAGP